MGNNKKLENIYVTDNLNKNSYLFSTTLKLKQLGFSSYAINKFQSENNNLNFEENRLDFFRKLSANIASPYPERILKSKLILEIKLNIFLFLVLIYKVSFLFLFVFLNLDIL